MAATGSFTAAAADLGLTKATVSKAVARLEARLGADLFHRTSRRLSLTDAGRRARDDADRLLAEGEAAEARVITGLEPRGLVRLAAPMSFGLRHVATRLPGFLAAHPGVSVDLVLGDAIVDLVAEGFDVALRIAALPDSSLRARKLFPIARSLVAAPSYLARHGWPQHPRDLVGFNCLGYTYLASPNRWHFSTQEGEDFSFKPMGSLQTNNAEALAPAVVGGLGIAVQPDFLIWEDLAAGRIVRVLPQWSPPPIALNVVTPPGRHRAQSVSALIAYFERALLATPWAARGEDDAIDF